MADRQPRCGAGVATSSPGGQRGASRMPVWCAIRRDQIQEIRMWIGPEEAGSGVAPRESPAAPVTVMPE